MPFVQTKIGQYVTNRINKDYGTNINIDAVRISAFGGVKIKKVLILDHHNDTLIYSNTLNTAISDVKRMFDGDLIFSEIRFNGLLFDLKTYRGEQEWNIDVFIKAFDTGKPPSGKHFLLKSRRAIFKNSHFRLSDENKENPKDVDFTRLNIDLNNFLLYGSNISTKIIKMSFMDHRGLYVSKLSSNFSYSKKSIKLNDLDLLTKESQFKANVVLNYRVEDFADFNDKVKFDAKIISAAINSNDISFFYNELGKNQFFYFRGATIKGTLNDLNISGLNLVDSNKSRIQGKINFKNIFGKGNQEFAMDGRSLKINSSYNNLVRLLPNVLGKKMPVELQKLGDFYLTGETKLTASTLDADLNLTSDLGKVQSKFVLTNMDFIDKASYKGNVLLDNFELGKMLNRGDVRKVSLDVDVDGKGFTEKYLNTKLKGAVTKLEYNRYSYSNILVDGNFKLPYYKGKISISDPNFISDFDGLIDLSNKENSYDFHVKVDYANLNKIKLVNDTIANFKGDVVVQVAGNTLDELHGSVFIKETVYQNTKDTYEFSDFKISSVFDDYKVKIITIDSPDIIQGQIEGKYQFDQLAKLARNSLGSLYANFKPEKVNRGQFLKFNFIVYNKIIEILDPDISLDANTVLKGNIKSDVQEFKLNFSSPKILIAKNIFDNVRIAIDNKNPLYNAFVELDSIKTPYYKIRDFNLINVTMKDTLFFRAEFKGGNKGQDYYNLNLYHTINKDNNNVVGLSKSEIKFKDNIWYLNQNERFKNKIIFDKSFENFNFDDIILSHEDQAITLKGTIKDKINKDLKLSFKNVDLFKITPENEQFVFNGNLNGEVNFKQNKAIYKPTASLVVDNLNINNTELGKFKFEVEGNQNLDVFSVNSYIQNKDVESFSTSGNFTITGQEAEFDLKFKLEKFNLGVMNTLGGEVLSNVRGFVSGNAIIQGSVKKPKFTGRLFIEKTGLTVPYLNVDYQINDRSIVDLIDQKFLIRNNAIRDTKFGTRGLLNGTVEHNNFSDWKLDLNIKSNRLVVLNTKDSEDAAYYGTAFMNGEASISGPTSGLFIKIAARSEKGTEIKIPINNAESVGENAFVHFLTTKEKYNKKMGIVESAKRYEGLEMEFDLDITPDAEVEVILDRDSGHGMKGKGFGSILMKINTLGKFNMWGDFQAYEGSYNFKYGGIIDKRFDVKKGGSISWEGNPMKANLNLEAVYKTIANPAVLLENSSFNRKVPVDVIIGVRGDLASPEPDFNIEFPTVSNVLKSEIQYKLNDKEARQTQALYLLSSGGFLSPEGINQSDFSGSLVETASGLLGGIIKSSDQDERFKVGINYISPDKRIGKETDGRFVATISSKVNERITINGKVGVPFGGVNESAVVGDLEILYRVNEDGTMNLRLFNRENDINYIGQGIGYTQGIGVTYEVDFDTFQEIVNKIFKNHQIGVQKKSGLQFQDSNLAPEYINFSGDKKSDNDSPKVNNEALIPEEY